MPFPKKESKRRRKWIADQEDLLSKKVEEYQLAVWKKLDREFISKLNSEDGNIKATSRNMSLLGRLKKIERDLRKNERKGLIKHIADKAIEQFDYVQDYFSKLRGGKTKTADKKVKNLLLKRIGFGLASDQFVETGALHDLWQDNSDIRQVQSQAVKAMAAGQSLSGFQGQLQNFVTGTGDKQGIVMRNIMTATRDIYAQNDRALSKQYADQLGLKHFIYQGGTIKTTRPFCRARNNKIYTSDQIRSWQFLEFQGKPDVYDPFIDCGGHNCRHQLDPISKELAAQL